MLPICLAAFVLVGIGVGVGVFYVNQANEVTQALKVVLKRSENNYLDELSYIINTFVYSIDIVESYNDLVNITSTSWSKYIDFLSLSSTSSSAFALTNELKFIPIVSFKDAQNFDTNMNIQLGTSNFTINPGNLSTRFLPFYCPLSYYAPNITPALYQFLGIDLCNTPTWIDLFQEMLAVPNQIAFNSRYVRRIDEYTFDIGRTISNGTAFAIHSLFVGNVTENLIRAIYQTSNIGDIMVKVISNRTGEVLFQSPGYWESNYLSNIGIRVKNLSLSVTFSYSPEYITTYLTNASSIILAIIIVLFCIISISVGAIWIWHEKKQQAEMYRTLRRQYSWTSKIVNYVNHEVRGPLTSIIGMITVFKLALNKMIAAPPVSDIPIFESDESADVNLMELIAQCTSAYNSCLLIKHIVDDLLDIKRLEEEKLIINKEHFNLKQYCSEFEQLMSRHSQEHPGVSFEICVLKDITDVYTDKMRLTQILLNFVTNAFKFVDEPDGIIRLVVDCEDDFGTLLFKVIDNGPGVDENNVKSLFQPFQQLNMMQREGGFGLGLYLCRMLSGLLGGTVGYEHADMRGSMFWLRIPN